MSLEHADVHLNDIAQSYKLKGLWRGAMTVIRPDDGKEYAWPRMLSEHEIRIMTWHLSGQEWEPRGTPHDGILDIYRENGSWKARLTNACITRK